MSPGICEKMGVSNVVDISAENSVVKQREPILLDTLEKIRLPGNGDEVMKNMGPRRTEWLASVGIQTLDGDGGDG